MGESQPSGRLGWVRACFYETVGEMDCWRYNVNNDEHFGDATLRVQQLRECESSDDIQQNRDMVPRTKRHIPAEWFAGRGYLRLAASRVEAVECEDRLGSDSAAESGRPLGTVSIGLTVADFHCSHVSLGTKAM